MKKLLRKASKSIFKQLPTSTQEQLFSKFITVPLEIGPDITIKVATSADELRQSYGLLHDAYVEQGFIEPDKTGMRVLLQYALPTTTSIVVKKHDEVIGTLTIVKNNVLGLPMEHHFDLQGLHRQYPCSMAEITGLAIKKSCRRENGGNVLFPMLKYMYEYCRYYYHVKALAIVIHPKDISFYKGLMFFKDIPGNKIINYMNAPAACLCLDLDFALTKFQEIYSERRPENNLFSFFVEKKFPNLKYPTRARELSFDSVINWEILETFFARECELFERSTLADLQKIRTVYYSTGLNNFFENVVTELPFYQQHQRIAVNIQVQSQDLSFSMRITDLSFTGLGVVSEVQLELGQPYVLEFNLPNQRQVKLKAIVKNNTDSRFGLQIVQSDYEYEQFVSSISLERGKLKKVA